MGQLSGISVVFFALFAIALAAMYILTRRRLAPVGWVAGVGTVLNVILVLLISLAVENQPLQAIFVGLVVGVLFSGASVAMAAYFRGSEEGLKKDTAGEAHATFQEQTNEPPTTREV
jgi:uncharacterized membrane protein